MDNVQSLALSPAIEWTCDHVKLMRYKLRFVTANGGEVTLFNASKYQALFYDLIENGDPKLAKYLHNLTTPKSFSFSTFIGEKGKFRKVNGSKGLYQVDRGAKLEWYLATIDPRVGRALAAGLQPSFKPHFGPLELTLKLGKVQDHTYEYPPQDLRFTTLEIVTPAILWDNATKTRLPFSESNFLAFQLRKLEVLGLLRERPDPAALVPYLRFVRSVLQEKFLTVVWNGRVLAHTGVVGTVKVKINADVECPEVKESIWQILQLSSFVGVGVHTALGFGHCRILY